MKRSATVSFLQKTLPFMTAFAGALAGAYAGALPEHGAPGRFEREALAQPRDSAAAPARERSCVDQGPVRALLDPEERKALAVEWAAVLERRIDLGAKEPQAPKEPAPRSVESIQARRDADGLLERAQATREWTEGDQGALRRLLPALQGEDREDVLLGLARAINEGRVVVRGRAL